MGGMLYHAALVTACVGDSMRNYVKRIFLSVKFREMYNMSFVIAHASYIHMHVCFCLFVCTDASRTSQHFFNHVGTISLVEPV